MHERFFDKTPQPCLFHDKAFLFFLPNSNSTTLFDCSLSIHSIQQSAFVETSLPPLLLLEEEEEEEEEEEGGEENAKT